MGALIATFSHSLIIHFYTQVGVPVSSSQAIVGAVMGIGLVKGIKNVSFKKIFHIMIGWVLTPVGAGIFTFLLIKSVVFFKVVIY
jgi:PiT family inorganic phosphate transporter